MAAYGALTSLLLSFDNIRDHNLTVSLHSHQLQSLREKVGFLLHCLQNCSTKTSSSSHDSLETRIRNVAFRAEDLVAAAMDPDKTPSLFSLISYGYACLLTVLLSVIIFAIGTQDLASTLTLLLLSGPIVLLPELCRNLTYVLNVLVSSVGIIWCPKLCWGVVSVVTLLVSFCTPWSLKLIWDAISMLNVSVLSVGFGWFLEVIWRVFSIVTVLVIPVSLLWFLKLRLAPVMNKFVVNYFLRNWELDQIFKEVQLIAEAIEGGAVDAQLPSSAVSSSSRYSHISVTGKSTVVGMDKDLEMIKTKLGHGSYALKIVPIVGMGGIGKTTLAMMVYEDDYIQNRFDVRSWATVSEEYSFRSVVLDLLNLLELPKLKEEGDDGRLGDHLYKSLYDRRYIIVLDDVWDVKVWDDVRRFLPHNDNGSCVLLTTRSYEVAHYVNPHDPQHQMQFLHEHESQRLLHSQVFGEKECPDELIGLHDEIAGSCKGLPLALRVIGGLLSKLDRTHDSWRSFADSLKLASSKDNDEYERMEVLALSYKHLSLHLRPCFLYMGMFPEDYKVSVRKLTQLWAAEGFLRSDASKSSEELAMEYLKELIERNLILVSSKSSQNGVKSCKIHDVLRKLCLREAQKEKFLFVMDPQSSASEMSLNFYRRLSIHSSSLIIRPNIAWHIKVYSLIYAGRPDFFKRFGKFNYRVLRVLDLLTFQLSEFPPEIYGLICLRYLALCFDGRLHASISRLQNLQTINLRGWLFHATIPVEIWMIPNLRHLHIQETNLPPPPSGSRILSIQTLADVRNFTFDIQILDKIESIKKLSITYVVEHPFSEGWFKYKLENLAHLNHLERLKLRVLIVSPWPSRITYPQGLALPPSLKRLTLSFCKIPWERLMTIVSLLLNLEVLKLRGNACVGEEWEPMTVKFCALKLLELEELDVVHWRADETHFPCLQCLIVGSCYRLQEIPLGFSDIPTLERIKLFNCPPSVVNSAKKIREDQEQFMGSSDLKVSVSRSKKNNRRFATRS